MSVKNPSTNDISQTVSITYLVMVDEQTAHARWKTDATDGYLATEVNKTSKDV